MIFDRMLAIGIIAFSLGCLLVFWNIDSITKNDCDRFNKLFLNNVEYYCTRVPK